MGHLVFPAIRHAKGEWHPAENDGLDLASGHNGDLQEIQRCRKSLFWRLQRHWNNLLVQGHRLLIFEGELQTVQVFGQLKLSSVRNHSVCGIDFRCGASSGPEIRQIPGPAGPFGLFEPPPPVVVHHHPSQRSVRPPGCQPRLAGWKRERMALRVGQSCG